MQNKNYANIKIEMLPKREVIITGEITKEKMMEMQNKAIAKLKENLILPGFRKGTAPDNIVLQKVGEMTVLEEAGEMGLSEAYIQIIEDEKLDVIGRPEITVTKIAIGNPLGFKIKSALLPDVKLADYKKIAKESSKGVRDKSYEVTEKEIDDVVLNLRKNVAHEKLHRKSGVDVHNHNHREIKDEDLPEVNDDFLKMIGDFKSIGDLREKIKENITKEKELKEKDKRRIWILESIMKDSILDIPQIIVDGEIEKMLAQFKDDITKAGVEYKAYLEHIKKGEDDLRKEWQETAEKKAKSQVILNTIAREEKIVPDENVVKQEMENILSHYKDAERFRVRMYVETFLTNELVFQFLEKQK
jgi:FKBP-type peptidyl-prolyl cis-trans isomerase (trigger factor)